jgi:hypothetical protein
MGTLPISLPAIGLGRFLAFGEQLEPRQLLAGLQESVTPPEQPVDTLELTYSEQATPPSATATDQTGTSAGQSGEADSGGDGTSEAQTGTPVAGSTPPVGGAKHLGPQLGDPTGVPSPPCAGSPGGFCQSDDIHAWESYVWKDNELVPVPQTVDDPGPADPWFWYVDLVLVSYGATGF